MLPSVGKMRASAVVRRLTYACASLAPAWAVIAFVTDGFAFRLGPVRVSSTEPVRPMLIGIVAGIWYLWRYSPAQRNADARWLSTSLKGVARLAVPVIVIVGCVIGIAYGTFAASGSDAYGYVSQATLWLRGELHVHQPIVGEVSWPEAAWTFTPLGYRPISDDGTIAPTYPPGLPIIMAIFQAIAGPEGPFFVVPLMAAAALYCTYLLGREATGSRVAGSLASLLLLASPVFLLHSIVPMTDVPAAAGWALVCVLALRQPQQPLLTGLVAGASLLIRPNLVLLAAVPLCAWLFAQARYRDALRPVVIRKAVSFVAGMVPGVIAVGAVNFAMYGSVFESGYGAMGDIYGIATAPQNLRNYGSWLLQTQTPLVALALIPLFARGALRPDADASPRACLVAVIFLSLLSYLFYAQFENWTYLRFLLPAYPAMFVLMSAGIGHICSRLPEPSRPAAAMLLAAACVALTVQFAKDQFVFDWREHDARYVQAGVRAGEITPENAVLFSSQHSGSLRYYTRRITLRYDLLPPDYLDAAIRQLRAKGRRSFLVIDEWEADEFRGRFAGRGDAGRLDAAPLARVEGQPDVLIYELTDRTE